MAFRSLLLLTATLATSRAGDVNYALDDYINLLPLPNDHTNGTTLLVLTAKLNWTWSGSGPQPEVLTAATRRYDGIIFAWGAPTVQPPRGLVEEGTVAVLKQVDISVDDPDDSFATLQLGMDESYTLDVPTSGTATIRAPTVWGALRALETLAQMIEYHPAGAPMGAQGDKMAQPWGSRVDALHQKEYTLAWAPWHIEDAPRFQHRGIMLDTARHFFTVPGILRQFDAMAAAKLNTMHWHITDGNSVPIESKLFPGLNGKGAYNPVTMIYTQEQIKGVVDYARHRGIRVVPEFDMPAHANAWALGAPAGAMLLCPKAGGFGNVTGFDTQGNPDAYFDATSEEAYSFLDAFIGEMATLFPDKVLHLGGDEDSSTCYNQSASVHKWLAAHPGVGLDDLIPYFWTRVHKIAAKHGKSVMNWEETFGAIYLKGGTDVCTQGPPGSDPVTNCKGGPGCTGFNHTGGNETAPGGSKSCIAPTPRHQAVNASLPPDAIVHAWTNQGNMLLAQLTTPKFRSVSSMGYYFSAMAGLSIWEYIYNTDPACIYNGMCLYDLPLESQKAFLGIEAAIWTEHEDENTLDTYWTNLALLGERLWSQNATILKQGDEYPPNYICKQENATKPGCCKQVCPTCSHSAGCANYENPSINSRFLKHRCRLEQRGFRPRMDNTDIFAFQSKWNQCASWLPPVSARNEHPSLPTAAETETESETESESETVAAEGALLKRLQAAGVSVDDLEEVKALVVRARKLEL